jgi:predicted nucleic acid-binding protein
VLVAGIGGFKARRSVANPSASFLREWLENDTFTWLLTEEILSEYKEVLTRLGVRRNLVGQIINLLREVAEFVEVRGESDISPDPDDNVFCACAEDGAAAFIVTLNRKDYQRPNCRRTFGPAARRVRPERHNPHSITTLRMVLARHLIGQIAQCPFCGSRSG